MERILLHAEVRKQLGKSQTNLIRKQGFIPAVIYKRNFNQPLKIRRLDFLKILHEYGGENPIIQLEIFEDDKLIKKAPTLLKEIQYHPLTEEVIHIDFQEISLTQKVTVKVPIKAKGEPIGVKQQGATLEHLLWELELECLPTEIPKEVEVDVSHLKLNDVIYVKDIVLPKKIKILNDPELIVFSLIPPRKEEAPEEVAEEVSEPEVIKEKKEESSEEQQ